MSLEAIYVFCEEKSPVMAKPARATQNRLRQTARG